MYALMAGKRYQDELCFCVRYICFQDNFPFCVFTFRLILPWKTNYS